MDCTGFKWFKQMNIDRLLPRHMHSTPLKFGNGNCQWVPLFAEIENSLRALNFQQKYPKNGIIRKLINWSTGQACLIQTWLIQSSTNSKGI